MSRMTGEVSTIRGYDEHIAQGYDLKSAMDKGNREAHRSQILDLTARLCPQPELIVDIGCGTGFFTRAFLDAYPQARAVCIDGSLDMLSVARVNLESTRRAQLLHSRFEQIDWSDFSGGVDVVFSALAIHHLEHTDKWRLFERIHDALAPGGLFILIDQFSEEDPAAMALLEYLACCDIQRRIAESMGVLPQSVDLNIDTLIDNDRMMRAYEGDKDAPLSEQMRQMKAAGFAMVVQFMQESRYFGCVAQKACA